jgi:acyl phosphate:glycerol-3-phosphate acyltransferase
VIGIIVFVVLAFLFGSIPFGYIISRIVSKKDIRLSGSGNIGATNVSRVLGLKWGLLSFFFDFMKGYLPFVLAMMLFPELSKAWLLWMSIPAILGHNFSPFLGFKGGKGISTTAGLLIAYHPLLGVWSLISWLLMLFLFGYVSLASIVALVFAPLLVLFSSWLVSHPLAFYALLAMALLGIFQHRSNISRLISRSEKRMLPFSLFKL